MKVATSYFYQIRFFKPYMIPISTALYDPKWFYKDEKKRVYIDKRGVINGIKFPAFSPNKNSTCPCEIKNPNNCEFIKSYRNKIFNIDFNFVERELKNLSEIVKNKLNFQEEPIFVFIVYETPNNLCSERKVIQEYFKINGVQCEELDLKID